MTWSSPGSGSGGDIYLSISRGLVPGITSAAAAASTDIWAAGTSFVQPATAAICNVSSTSVSDTSAGSGAQTVTISGIGSDYSTVTETVSLNGNTNVPTVNTYWHINRAFVASAGSGGTQVGTITIISAAAGTPTLGTLAIGANQTQSTIYMVPLGYTAYITFINVATQSSNINGTCDIAMYAKPFGGVFRVQSDFLFREGSTTSYTRDFRGFLSYAEKSIIKFRCVAASHATDVAIDYDIFLVAT